MPGRAGPRAPAAPGVDDAARRLLGRARTDLEFRTRDELLADLPSQLDMLQRTVLARPATRVGRATSARGTALAWTAEAQA